MLDLDYLSHLDVGRYDRNTESIFILLPGEAFVARIIQIFVTLHALEVIVRFFGHGDTQHEDEGCHIGEEKADFEEGDELTQRNDQEEHVVEKLELVVKHHRDERGNVVLLIIQLVCAEALRDAGALYLKFPFLFDKTKSWSLNSNEVFGGHPLLTSFETTHPRFLLKLYQQP